MGSLETQIVMSRENRLERGCPDQQGTGTASASFEAYVINLAQAVERYAFMKRQLQSSGIKFNRVDAVDGKTLTLPIPEASDWSYRLLHGRNLSPYEVGCYLSHIKAIDLFLASNLDYCLILEDDALLDTDLKAIIDSAIVYHDDWDILRLSTVSTGRHFIVRRMNGRGLGVCFTREKGSSGYVLNRRAAAVFRKRLLPMRLAYDIAFDLEYLMGLKALAVRPFPINQQAREFKTQVPRGIKLPAWRYVTVFPFRTVLEVFRIVCRVALYVRLRLKPIGAGSSRSGPVVKSGDAR